MNLSEIEAKFYEHKRLYPKDISAFIDHKFQLLLEVAKAAKDTFNRQNHYQARWAMEDIQKALEELEKE